MTDIALDEKAMGAAVAEPDDTQWHTDRMDSIVRDLWAANDIDLHMCNDTVKRNQSGLLHDIRNSWRIVRRALATAPTSQVAPANPAQVTDAMVEAASAKYREIGARCNWQHSWPSEEAFHEILTAAIGAGGQAVAWRISCPDDEIYGRGPDTVRFHPLSPDEIASGYTQQPLSTLSQPHPTDERVVEALREIADGCTGRIDRDSLPCRIAQAALSATEGR
jgi:hypothetical protein